MARNAIAPFVIGALLLFGCIESLAQSCTDQPSCSISSIYAPFSNCAPILPVTASHCTQANWGSQCTAKNNKCSPSSECPSCDTGGHPIDLATGNTDISQTDIRVPGLGGGLTLARTWNSVWPAIESAYREGLFGPNWRSTFEERVYPGSDGYMKYARGDGSFWSFGLGTGLAISNPNGFPTFTPVSPANETAILLQGLTNWTLLFQNGEQRMFDKVSGNLLSITDRNGNTTQLTYDGSFRLVTVTDPASRHLYFAYASPASYLVTAVTSDVGLSLSYAYDGQERLSQVTKPDHTTVSFQYDSNSNISAVLDSSGKVLESHTYDSQGKGLTSSRSGGVDAITVSYPQPPPLVVVTN
jgi:YD repeat-containing protein